LFQKPVQVALNNTLTPAALAGISFELLSAEGATDIYSRAFLSLSFKVNNAE